MSVVLYDALNRRVGASCQTADEARELMRAVKAAEYAKDEATGLIVARRSPSVRVPRRASSPAPQLSLLTKPERGAK